MRKGLILLATIVAVFSINLVVYKMNNTDDLFEANVDALAGVEGTFTTWRCKGDDGICHAECGQCNTIVNEDGELRGFHICKQN